MRRYNATVWPTFAHVCVVWRPVPAVGQDTIAAHAPTRANVAHSLAIPPVVGTSRKSGQGEVCGNSSRLRHSLFSLSDYFLTP